MATIYTISKEGIQKTSTITDHYRDTLQMSWDGERVGLIQSDGEHKKVIILNPQEMERVVYLWQTRELPKREWR